MYGGQVNPAAAAGLPATGLAFGVSTTIGILVAALTLVFAGLAIAKMAPAPLRTRPRR